jgi:ATP-dependent DNA helicase RecG
VHKAYHAQIPIQIRVQSDQQLYISNDAVLPQDFSADTFMKLHRSIPYNPSIANVFFRAGFIEAWGRGIERICDACSGYGVPLPDYSVKSYEVMVKFKGLITEPVLSNTENDNSKIPPKYRQNIAKIPQGDILEGQETRILIAITENPKITKIELSDLLGFSARQINNSIRSLTQSGMIVRVGGKRYGYWKIHTKS